MSVKRLKYWIYRKKNRKNKNGIQLIWSWMLCIRRWAFHIYTYVNQLNFVSFGKFYSILLFHSETPKTLIINIWFRFLHWLIYDCVSIARSAIWKSFFFSFSFSKNDRIGDVQLEEVPSLSSISFVHLLRNQFIFLFILFLYFLD